MVDISGEGNSNSEVSTELDMNRYLEMTVTSPTLPQDVGSIF